MAIGGCVHLEKEGWEEDIHSQSKHPNESTTLLTLVSSKAVQGVAEVRNMEAMVNQDLLAIEGDDGRAMTKDWCERIIAHANSTSQDGIVGDKGRFVRDHVVGCT